MRTYRVTWELEMDAEDPRAAAKQCLLIMRDPGSVATVFTVEEVEGGGEWMLDLLDPEGT